MADKDFFQGQLVGFSIGSENFVGTVCGQATIDMPVIGKKWIIKPSKEAGFPNKEYPFSHIAINGCHIWAM
jgi:hypothetical protein